MHSVSALTQTAADLTEETLLVDRVEEVVETTGTKSPLAAQLDLASIKKHHWIFFGAVFQNHEP